MAKSDLNHVVLIGRITRDCGSDERSFGYLPNGNARASISIAVNRSKKEGDNWVEEANFFNVTIWGKMAEGLKPYLLKGQQVAIEGYLKQDQWEKDGQKMSKVSIVADNVQLLGSRPQGNGSNPSGGYGQGYQNNGFNQGQGFSGGYQNGGFQNQGFSQPNTQFQPNNAPTSNPYDNSFGGADQGGFPEDIPF